MGRGVQWYSDAWDEYCDWQRTDKAILKRINDLIKDARRSPFDGIGKPEPLRGNLSGFWSRRIDEKNWLVYRVSGEMLEIVSCKGHYDDTLPGGSNRPAKGVEYELIEASSAVNPHPASRGAGPAPGNS